MDYWMNPFHFVPLPHDGPRPIPDAALEGPRWEGYLSYAVETLTPLHLTGRITSRNNSFEKKYFLECGGKKVIPGASIRGMLSAYIEAVTGSDLRCFTRGDEGDLDPSQTPPYGKCHNPSNAQRSRHVGFLLAAPDDAPLQTKAAGATLTYTYLGRTHNRKRYERCKTLPPGFGRGGRLDAARYLFGHVSQGDGDARMGRLHFEDLVLPESLRLKKMEAWDLVGDAVMGCPNPRANTAWYFTPGDYRVRHTNNGKHVWEVLADRVRGRKFYFHQDPEPCLQEYGKWSQAEGGWMKLAKYDVEVVPARTRIDNGRIYFSDLPEPMLLFLYHSLTLDPGMAHKLGALKPFGFGSVRLIPERLHCRQSSDPLAPLGLPQRIGGKIPPGFLYNQAYRLLKRIMHFPEHDEKEKFLFLYPPYHQHGANAFEKGFAMVENANGARHPTPENSRKLTLFFDHYQKQAQNYRAVMGES